MDFGSLPIHSRFKSELAPLHPGSITWLSRFQNQERLRARLIGAPQWTIPKFCKSLANYAQFWNALEFNASFYKISSPEQVKKWANETPSDFRFFVKIHQGLSHDMEAWRNPLELEKRMHEYVNSWSHLGEKWEQSFLQLPPHFEARELPALDRWLSFWPKSRPLQIEFRHESWFRGQQLISEGARLCAKKEVGVAMSDTPGRRDASHGTITSPFLMVRFLAQSEEIHGEINARDLERMEQWAIRLRELESSGLQGFAFFIHTPEHYWVPHLTRKFREMMNIEEASPLMDLLT